ncbi:MAG: sulfite exporter TauE/SafE family protein [Candidatus Nanopelagicales bacterium]|nr:sulfite exporter TauE/SafE family protein [Candidatus Nanopelagicales bacterium]
MSTGTDSGELQRRTVPVVGMTCDACEKRVGRALRRIPGVESVDVSARKGTAVLVGTRLPATDRVEAAIRSAGYEPGTPSWLTAEPSTWVTVVGGALAIGALVVLASSLGVGGLIGELADPSRGGILLVLALGVTAGFSTCMAMVGGLVLGFSASHAAGRTRDGQVLPSFLTRMRPQVAFNAGRIVGFGLLGAVLGSLGSAVGLPTRLMGALALAVAVVMFLLGVRLTGISPRMAAWSPRLPAGVAGLLGIDSAAARPYSDTRTALVGAGTFFLPCGFTQAVQVYALSTGSPLSAGLILAAFALGTTPGLLAVATVPEIATGKARGAVLQVVGVVVLAFALLNVTSGLRLLGVAGSTPPAVSAQQVSDNVTVSGGVQTVTMTQTRDGYTPADTVVHAGMPIIWSIQATSKWECSAFLRVPDLGVSVDLQDGPNTVKLPALPPGVVPFTCVMGMYTGNLIAIDPPA